VIGVGIVGGFNSFSIVERGGEKKGNHRGLKGGKEYRDSQVKKKSGGLWGGGG